MSSQQRCQYTFPEGGGTVEESPLDIDARFLTTDGQWRCPRRTARPDEACCVFHQDPDERDLTADQLAQVFLETVNEESVDSAEDVSKDRDSKQGSQANGARRQRPSWTAWDVIHPSDDSLRTGWRRQARKQFIGATFGNIDLSYETFGDGTGYPIDLRAAAIGDLDLAHATVWNPLRLDGDGVGKEDSTQLGSIRLDDADVQEYISVTNRSVAGGISAEDAIIDGEVSLTRAAVSGDVSFKRTVIDGDALLKKAAFGNQVLFDKASVDGWASLFRASVADRVSFESASVGEKVTLKHANVAGRVTLYDATVEDGIWLPQANVRGLGPFSQAAVSLTEATANGEVWLKEASIGGDVSIDGTDVKERITFEQATVEGHVSLNEVTVEREPLYREGEPMMMRGRLTFDGATLGSLAIWNGVVEGKVILDDATVGGDVRMDGSTAAKQLSAEETVIEGDCSLDGIATEATVSLDDATIDGTVSLTEATIEQAFSMDRATVRGDLSGKQATIDTAVLTPTTVQGRMTFEEAVIRETIEIDPHCLAHPAVTGMSLTGASIAGGVLAADNRVGESEADTLRAEPFLYDLREAHLGDVSVAPDIRRDDWSGTSSLACAHIVEAQFDAEATEFPFRRGRVRALLREADWRLHTLVKGGYWRLAALDRFDEAQHGADTLLRALVVDPSLRKSARDGAWDDVWERLSNLDCVDVPEWVTPKSLATAGNSATGLPRTDPATRVSQWLRQLVASDAGTRVALRSESGPADPPLGSPDAVQQRLQAVAEWVTEQPDATRRAVLAGPAAETRVQRRRAMVEQRLGRTVVGAADLEEEITTLLAEAAATARRADTPSERGPAEAQTSGETAVPTDLTVDLAGMGIGFIGWTDGDLTPINELTQALAARRSEPLDGDTIRGIREAAVPIQRLARVLVSGLPDEDNDVDRSAEIDTILQEEYTAGAVARRSRRELATELAFGVADPAAVHPVPAELESTYLIAKNAATDQGDQFSAGEFFIQERIWARERHWRDLQTDTRGLVTPLSDDDDHSEREVDRADRTVSSVPGTADTRATADTASASRGEMTAIAVTTPSPLRALYRWTSNTLYGLLTGYGERPQRVLAWSVFVVVAFGLLFAGFGVLETVGGGSSGFATTPPYGSVLGYFIVSLEAFVTLVLGGSAQIESPLLRLVAQIEGFLGVFSISLFVFTLSRAVHR